MVRVRVTVGVRVRVRVGARVRIRVAVAAAAHRVDGELPIRGAVAEAQLAKPREQPRLARLGRGEGHDVARPRHKRERPCKRRRRLDALALDNLHEFLGRNRRQIRRAQEGRDGISADSLKSAASAASAASVAMEENGTGRNGCGQADESSSTFAHSLLLCDRSKRVCARSAQQTLGRSHAQLSNTGSLARPRRDRRRQAQELAPKGITTDIS